MAAAVLPSGRVAVAVVAPTTAVMMKPACAMEL